jgi:tRNA A-37 threonylcarbamoyl transferase component Bud32
VIETLGRYEILEKIGQGGFAIVYRAHDTVLDRPVALKELKSLLLTNAEWVSRFQREARAIARLDHPRIVTVHDVAEVDQRQFIVMRLVAGPGLDEWITERGRLSWPEAVEIMSAVAEGLDYAHAHGILHCDLKPANILMDPERGPLLTDFGFAKLAGEHSMSTSGDIVGTPHYIAPEIWEGQPPTPQSDIYALACILYEMVIGAKLFPGETPPAVMMAHFKPLELPQSWPAGAPPGVADIMKQALNRTPARRYATAAKLVEAVAALDEAVEPSNAAEMPEMVAMAETEPQGPAPTVADVMAPAQAAIVSEPQAAAIETQSESAQKPEQAPSDEVFAEAEQAEATISPAIAPAATPTHLPGTVQNQDGSAPHRRRRGGCLWGSLTVVVGAGLLLIGLAIFCSAMSDTVDTTIRTFVESALPNVEIGPTNIDDIHIPLPDTSEPITLEIDTDAGRLVIMPGTGREALVDGTATYNVNLLKPEILVDDNRFRVRHENGIGAIVGTLREDIRSDWNLKLGPVPMNLTINAGAAESDIELGGLALTRLEVSKGVSDFELSFSKPNPAEMETLEFGAVAGSAALTGLANANAAEINFESGPGDYTLEFGGELRRDVELTLQGGPGTLTVIIPENTAARTGDIDDDSVTVSARGAWQQAGNEYILAGATPEGHQISISVDMEAGRLELRNP